MQETWVRSLDQEDPLERGMEIHSSILAWRISWTEESGGLHSMGLQRVGHNWATNTTHTHTHTICCSVVSNSLRPHELQHSRPPCPPPTPGVHLASPTWQLGGKFFFNLEIEMNIYWVPNVSWGFPGGTVIKNPPANARDARDMGSIPGSERSPGVGNTNPLQYACLKNSMGRGAQRVIVHGVAKSQSWLSMHAEYF